MDPWGPEMLLAVTACFLLAGWVKGVVGVGLPTISLIIMSMVAGFHPAVAIILLPSILTNVWQALAGPYLRTILARTWPLLLASLAAIWFGVDILARTDERILKGLLGIFVTLYGLVSLATPQIPAPGRWHPLLAPAVGAVNGFITGLTGTFGIPGMFYLQALGFTRDAFVQAMGVLFTVSATGFGAGLAAVGVLDPDLAGLSALALIPAFAGMAVGQAVRRRISETAFRRAFFAAVIGLGLFLIWRSFLQ